MHGGNSRHLVALLKLRVSTTLLSVRLVASPAGLSCTFCTSVVDVVLSSRLRKNPGIVPEPNCGAL